MKIDTLVISDIHIGSPACDAEKVLQVLRGHDYKRLIIVGDLAEAEGEISPQQFHIINHLSDHRDKDIVYVDGNHDEFGESLLKKRLGIPVLKQYEVRIGGRRFCFKHGHRRFDKMYFIFSWVVIDKIFMTLVDVFRRWKILRDLLDNFHAGISSSFDRKAIKYAEKRKFDVIVCGHTHIPTRLAFTGKQGRKVEYFNCGTFMGCTCSYIIIDEKGNVTLNVWCPQSGIFKSL